MKFFYLLLVLLSIAVGVASIAPTLTFAAGAICGIASLLYFLE